MKVALILAGGKGTRLAQVRDDIPKPMMPVLGKPILEYQINLLKTMALLMFGSLSIICIITLKIISEREKPLEYAFTITSNQLR
jgi:choline kinase